MNKKSTCVFHATPGVVAVTIALAAITFFLAGFSPLAGACGTLPAEQQQQLDAEQLQQLHALTTDMANTAEAIFVGSVTALDRPLRDPQRSGQVTLTVSTTLKGPEAKSRTLAWDDRFILSCNRAEGFDHVGFRDGGAYIVYVKDDRVLRSAAADALRDSALLKLSDEISLVAGQVRK